MIVDITLNQIKNLNIAGSQLLRYETQDTITLYYVNQSPVIFRAIISKPTDENKYLLLISSLPKNIPVLNVIEDHRVPAMILEVLQNINLSLDLPKIEEEI